MEIRKLVEGDQQALYNWLDAHEESSLFLRSNLEKGGIVDCGGPYEGTYLGAWDGEVLCGVAVLFWNGKILLQSPEHAGLLVPVLQALGPRPIDGLVGPWGQVEVAQAALRVSPAQVRFRSREILYRLTLSDLSVPSPRAGQRLVARMARSQDAALLADWYVAYRWELEGEVGTPGARARELEQRRAALEERLPTSSIWILEDEGRPVATTSFNARTAKMAQLGGVWTPPELRGRGYARAVIADHLRHARGEGVRTAILFTGEGNRAAQRCYTALGFTPIGDYGICLFAPLTRDDASGDGRG